MAVEHVNILERLARKWGQHGIAVLKICALSEEAKVGQRTRIASRLESGSNSDVNH